MANNGTSVTNYQKLVYELSEQLVLAQKPIRILNAIKWGPEIQNEFFKNNAQELPKVDQEYYSNSQLGFDINEKQHEFFDLERLIQKKLGQFSVAGKLMIKLCQEYRSVISMLKARGTPDFAMHSSDLYGSASDVFYAGGPSLSTLADTLNNTLNKIGAQLDTEFDEKKFTSEQAIEYLNEKLKHHFDDPKEPVHVFEDDGILADAAAGADTIKLRKGVMFSERELRILEVHEGWVHVSTTLNGRNQPYCTFLSKGAPSTTIFQEGLAVLVEILSFSSHPNRIRKITNRIKAIEMAENGADFLEVYRYFLDQDYEPDAAYQASSRVFRGSTPTLGPFSKDLAYSKGFMMIYNYLRVAISEGRFDRIPLLFIGKTSLENIASYEELIQEELIVPPKYLPAHFRDLAGLSAWLSYSHFFNLIDLNAFYRDFKHLL